VATETTGEPKPEVTDTTAAVVPVPVLLAEVPPPVGIVLPTLDTEVASVPSAATPVVTAPDGRSFRWGDPRLRHALAADLGRPVELRRDLDGIQDLPRSLLITTEATLQALGEELNGPVDLRRFRPNLHLDLDADAWAELAWEGGELAFAGGVRLRLMNPCERCAIPTRHPDTQVKWPYLLRHLHDAHEQLFGVNARPLTAGRIAAGEAVELIPASGSRASGR